MSEGLALKQIQYASNNRKQDTTNVCRMHSSGSMSDGLFPFVTDKISIS